MGFPVGNQVDFMLPLLGLKAVLGSAVVADTAAAQDDDDGPHQPEPWGWGSKTERQGQSEHQPEGSSQNREAPSSAHLVNAGTVRPHSANSHLEPAFHFHKCLCRSERHVGRKRAGL